MARALDARRPRSSTSARTRAATPRSSQWSVAVDTRVLLAHRIGAAERRWPEPEDRFASDLLLPERVRDPWLRELTTSAASARIPIVLGGHSIVGPGLRIVVRANRWT